MCGPWVAELVGSVWDAQTERIGELEPQVGCDSPPEAVHQMRVALRRQRSLLGLFAKLLTPETVELRLELGWLAAALGKVRDVDVLADRAESFYPGCAEIEVPLAMQRRAEVRELRVALSSSRRKALRALAPQAARDFPVALMASDRLRGLHRKLDQAVKRAPETGEWHQARIEGKRFRYGVEVMGCLFPEEARALAPALGRLQDLLGEHHDLAVFRAWLKGRGVDLEPVWDRAHAIESLLPAAYAEVRKPWRNLRGSADRLARKAWRQM